MGLLLETQQPEGECRLQQDGIDGIDGIDDSGICTPMADARLANGAFYTHFASKDDLVAHVVAHEPST